MDALQTTQALIWVALAGACVLSIAWGMRRAPRPFLALQAVLGLVCVALAIQAFSLARLPATIPAYVELLLARAGTQAPTPAALTPEAWSDFEAARGRVRSPIHRTVTTLLPSSRSMFVEVTFVNRDVLLLSIAYRNDGPLKLPVSIAPYALLVESAVFIPHSPLAPGQVAAQIQRRSMA